MVYARALRAREANTSCEFESRLRHINRGVAQLVECALWEREADGSSPSTPTQADNKAETLRAIAGALEKEHIKAPFIIRLNLTIK